MKYCHYALRVDGDTGIIDFLKPHVPIQYNALADVRNKARAIEELFAPKVHTKIVVMRAVQQRGIHALGGAGPV